VTLTAHVRDGLPDCDVWQIYYDKTQERYLETYASRYFQEGLSPFFENYVIANHKFDRSKKYTAIFSHAYKLKWKNPKQHTIAGLIDLIGDADAVAPCGHWGRGSGYFEAMERFHPGSRHIADVLLSKMGLPSTYDVQVDAQVYFNAMIVKTDIYARYVRHFLKPAMKLMEEDAELRRLCWQDSNYAKTKGADMRERMRLLLGVPYYPMHPFILERMFAYWAKLNHVKINAV
jgi:hypothetical protein